VAVARLVIGPMPQPSRLEEFLRGRFDMPIAQADLRTVLEFAEPPDAEAQARLFYHFGAALRHENGRKAAA
jgi:hypothetical protein